MQTIRSTQDIPGAEPDASPPASIPARTTAAPARVRRRRVRAASQLAAVLAGATLLVAACGSGGSSSSTSASGTAAGGSSNAGGQQRSGPAYAQCMRQHGVTNFPDPQGPDQNQFLIPADVQNDPHFPAASKACEALRPQQGAAGGGGGVSQSQLLSFARCMRANGVPKFPDPLSNGGLNVSGVDTSSPQFRHAAQICADKTGLQLGGGQ